MEYCIQAGDNFHSLAQRLGGTCADFIQVNPNVNPLNLQIGQKIVLPDFKDTMQGQGRYADIAADHGQEFAGDYLDEVEMEIEGTKFRVRRIGEPKTPHEIHLILPRVEIRNIQPGCEPGPSDKQIMLSNLNIVLSPRLKSEGDSLEQAKPAVQTQAQTNVQQATQQLQQGQALQSPQYSQYPQSQQYPQSPQSLQSPALQSPYNTVPQYGQGGQPAGQPAQEQPQGFTPMQEHPRWRMTFPFKKR